MSAECKVEEGVGVGLFSKASDFAIFRFGRSNQQTDRFEQLLQLFVVFTDLGFQHRDLGAQFFVFSYRACKSDERADDMHAHPDGLGEFRTEATMTAPCSVKA